MTRIHKDRLTPGLSHLRVALSADFYLGPGRADLMQAIEETMSIAAAARKMRMSYKRAWDLVQVLNAGFAEPVIVTARGGSEQGRAELTDFGRDVLSRYRAMEKKTEAAIAEDVADLVRHVVNKGSSP